MTPEQFEALADRLDDIADSQKVQNDSIKTIADGLKSVTQDLNTLSTNFNQTCIEMAVTATKLEALRNDFDEETTLVEGHEKRIILNTNEITEIASKIENKKTGLDAHESRLTELENWFQRVIATSAILSAIVGIIVAKSTEIITWFKQ